MKVLPFKMIKEILKYQTKWWLKRNGELFNIEKLSRIPQPRQTSYNCYKVLLNNKKILNNQIILSVSYYSSHEYEFEVTYVFVIFIKYRYESVDEN